jgi:hypothetical protein
MNDLIKGALPWIGTALGTPLVGIAVSAISKVLGLDNATVDSVKTLLSGMSSEDLLKLKVAEMETQAKLQEIGFDNVYKLAELEVRAIESVNKTMQAEAAAEHWPTYSWRPAIGFAVAFNLVSASLMVFIAYLFKPELVPQIPAMLTAQAGLNAVAMPILGIASYFRGKGQADPNIPAAIQIPAFRAN